MDFALSSWTASLVDVGVDGHRHISYYALIDPARNLTGKFEGLIVRYESEPAFPSTTSTNATQVSWIIARHNSMVTSF